MTKRYYARFADRLDGTDLYVVIDSETGEEMSARLPFHEANDDAGKRNGDAVSARHAAWDVALGYEPLQVLHIPPTIRVIPVDQRAELEAAFLAHSWIAQPAQYLSREEIAKRWPSFAGEPK